MNFISLENKLQLNAKLNTKYNGYKWRLTLSAELCTLNNIGYLEGTLHYYYATPGEPLQGSPGAAW